jgi:hypothetical protein
MSAPAELSADSRTLAVRVPLNIAKRCGRKVVVAPETESTARPANKPNEALVSALARAFRWRSLIETGVHGTIGETAAAEKVNASYVSRVLRLALLSPDIVEGILNGDAPEITLSRVLRPFPADWRQQRVGESLRTSR